MILGGRGVKRNTRCQQRYLLDADEVRQLLNADGASAEPLDADGSVLERSGIGGPLELAVGIGLNDGQVVEEVDDGLLLASALGVVLGKGVADQELAAVIGVSDSLENGGEVDLGGTAPVPPPAVSLVGKEKGSFGDGKTGNGGGANGHAGGREAGGDSGGSGSGSQGDGGEHEGGGGGGRQSEDSQKGLHGVQG